MRRNNGCGGLLGACVGCGVCGVHGVIWGGCTWSPAGVNRTADKVWSWPFSVFTQAYVLRSHSLALMSADAVASHAPVRSKATAVTAPVCPFNVRSYWAVS